MYYAYPSAHSDKWDREENRPRTDEDMANDLADFLGIPRKNVSVKTTRGPPGPPIVDIPTECNKTARWMREMFKRNQRWPQLHEVMKKFGYSYPNPVNEIYKCALKFAKFKLTKIDLSPYYTDKWYEQRSGVKRGTEEYDKPIRYQKTPVDHFVNGLREGWDNLSKGKTFFGGQPTIITGSVPWYVPRPLIIP